VSVVCCQVEVSATSWSLGQRSPTECGVSKKNVIAKPRKMRRPRPPRGCRVIGKKNFAYISKLRHLTSARIKLINDVTLVPACKVGKDITTQEEQIN
jgi:hypothetical protein